MSNRFTRWVRLYWPTFLYVAVLCAVYCGLVYVFIHWVWPDALRNGEPITTETKSTAVSLLADKVQFQTDVENMYLSLGGIALLLYLFYCLSGRLSMSYRAHVSFAKALLVFIISAFLGLILSWCSDRFIFSTHVGWFESIKQILLWVSVATCAGGLLKMLWGILKRKTRKEFSSRWWAFLYTVLALALFALIALGDNLLVPGMNLLNDLIKPDAPTLLEAAGNTTRFILTLPVDILLPLFMLIPFCMLLLAIHYASPLSESSVPDGKTYSLTSLEMRTEEK